MLKKVLLLIVLLFVVGAVIVAAQEDEERPSGLMWVNTGEDEYGWVQAFRDGRLNNFDLSAPVAIYYSYYTVDPTTESTYTVPDGIQLLAIDPVTNNGSPILTVPVEEIRHMIDEHLLGADGLVAEQDGFSLHYAAPGWFWVETPADEEGKVYTFQWPDVVLHP
jgi:hypothetical protein